MCVHFIKKIDLDIVVTFHLKTCQNSKSLALIVPSSTLQVIWHDTNIHTRELVDTIPKEMFWDFHDSFIIA